MKRSADTTEATRHGFTKPLTAALGVLREVAKEYPAAKPLFGLLGVVTIATVTGIVFVFDWRVAFFSIASCIAFATTIVAFAAITRLGPQSLRSPAAVLMWASVVLFVASLTCLLSSVFFRIPLDLSIWVTGHQMTYDSRSASGVPPEADKAIGHYLDTIDAYNRQDYEHYYSGFAKRLDCFYSVRDADIRVKRRRLVGALSVTRDDIEYVGMEGPSHVVLCDRGHYDYYHGKGRKHHNKAIVMRKDGDRWRIVVETVGRHAACYRSPC